jgi:hypothetical protein
MWLVSSEYSSKRGDDLLARILAGEETDLGDKTDLGIELEKECWRGYPIDRISALLQSDRESAVKSGAYIASELAENSRPLLKDLEPLINYPNTWVRSDAINAVNLAATVDDGEIVARVIECIVDNERSTRFSAFTLLAASKRDKLEAAWGCIRDVEVMEALRLVLDEEGTVSSAEIQSRLGDSSQLMRLFGLLSAARISDRRADDLLAAIEADDDEIRQFALEEAFRRKLIPPTVFSDRAGL